MPGEGSDQRTHAIETVYDGYRFRSRLEARWAVFFDTAGIDWRYEHEGFELQSGEWYLPDFYLPDVGLRSTEKSPLWVEIKPTEEKAQFGIAEDFVETVGESMAILTGEVGEGVGYSNFQMGLIDDQPYWDNFMHFMKCEECGLVKYEFQEINYMSCESCGSHCTYKHPVFDKATLAARSARFEHGESPGTTGPTELSK